MIYALSLVSCLAFWSAKAPASVRLVSTAPSCAQTPPRETFREKATPAAILRSRLERISRVMARRYDFVLERLRVAEARGEDLGAVVISGPPAFIRSPACTDRVLSEIILSASGLVEQVRVDLARWRSLNNDERGRPVLLMALQLQLQAEKSAAYPISLLRDSARRLAEAIARDEFADMSDRDTFNRLYALGFRRIDRGGFAFNLPSNPATSRLEFDSHGRLARLDCQQECAQDMALRLIAPEIRLPSFLDERVSDQISTPHYLNGTGEAAALRTPTPPNQLLYNAEAEPFAGLESVSFDEINGTEMKFVGDTATPSLLLAVFGQPLNLSGAATDMAPIRRAEFERRENQARVVKIRLNPREQSARLLIDRPRRFEERFSPLNVSALYRDPDTGEYTDGRLVLNQQGAATSAHFVSRPFAATDYPSLTTTAADVKVFTREPREHGEYLFSEDSQSLTRLIYASARGPRHGLSRCGINLGFEKRPDRIECLVHATIQGVGMDFEPAMSVQLYPDGTFWSVRFNPARKLFVDGRGGSWVKALYAEFYPNDNERLALALFEDRYAAPAGGEFYYQVAFHRNGRVRHGFLSADFEFTGRDGESVWARAGEWVFFDDSGRLQQILVKAWFEGLTAMGPVATTHWMRRY